MGVTSTRSAFWHTHTYTHKRFPPRSATKAKTPSCTSQQPWRQLWTSLYTIVRSPPPWLRSIIVSVQCRCGHRNYAAIVRSIRLFATRTAWDSQQPPSRFNMTVALPSIVLIKWANITLKSPYPQGQRSRNKCEEPTIPVRALATHNNKPVVDIIYYTYYMLTTIIYFGTSELKQ